MKRDGFTITMVFSRKCKLWRRNWKRFFFKENDKRNDWQYSYISRQALRYNIVQQAEWDNTPVDGKSGVVNLRRRLRLKIIRKLTCLVI